MLRPSCNVTLPPSGRISFSRDEIIKLLPDMDAVLACSAFDAAMIEAAPKLKIISNYGAGYDRIDTRAAAARGIFVTNIPDSTMYATAELALALLLALERRVCELDRALHAGRNDLFGMGKCMGGTLRGKTLGIVGMGHIGRALADMAAAMGMNIVYHNRRRLPEAQARGCKYMELDALIKCCDALSINCPLTDATRGLIGRREIALMKSSAVIINVARGAILDMDALIKALQTGRIAGAGLDVYPNEPEVPEALRKMENVVLTPHIGSNVLETREMMAAACAERILAALEGGRPENIVNGI